MASNILEYRYTTLPQGWVPGSGVQVASLRVCGGSMLSGDDWEDEGVAEEGSAAVSGFDLDARCDWPLAAGPSISSCLKKKVSLMALSCASV